MSNQSAYARAGVDLDAGNQVTDLIKQAVQSTFNDAVLSDVGAFGGLYSLSAVAADPNSVLVASTDGVGTKTKVAARLDKWDGIGADIVNHCVNDILVQGARPLFFLDYVAAAQLQPQQIAAIVSSVANACQEAGCALLGGETAEMPGVYLPGAVDLVGTVVGVVSREDIIDGRHISAGDVVLGLPSSGLHTNGFSLARQALAGVEWSSHLAQLGATIGQALLQPHRSYLQPVMAWRHAGIPLHGLAHITGGGLIDNPPRILPAGLGMVLQRQRWRVPPIFDLIQERGGVEASEMLHVFNMGLGMLAILAPDHADHACRLVPEARPVGHIVPGPSRVTVE